MRNLRLLDAYRIVHPFAGEGDDRGGAFLVPSPGTTGLSVIASNGYGWDHVSVSLKNRCPNWGEMNKIARLFFGEDECPYQLHPPEKDYVNNHPYTLHLWRCHDREVPRPPSVMVGLKGVSAETIQAMSPEQVAAIQERLVGQLEGKP
jgi:hypothetical protein